jgi:hypothetical protein
MKINNGAAGVHEKSELQFFQAKFWVGFRVKEKIGVGFRGLFFLLTHNLAQIPTRYLPLSFGEAKERKMLI